MSKHKKDPAAYVPPFARKRHFLPFFVVILFGVLSFALGVNLSLHDAHSATGTIYLQTNSTDIKNKIVTIAIRITPGGAHPDTVTTTLGYDPSKFTYKSVDYTGSPFTTQLPAKITKDNITVTSTRLGGETVDQDSLIALVSFAPRASETKFTADFSLDGNAAHAGVATDPVSASETLTFTQPSATSIPTNPLANLITGQQEQSPDQTLDSPLANVTPADGLANYTGAQILLKTSGVVNQIRQISPRSIVLLIAGFILICSATGLLLRLRAGYAELHEFDSHMNQIREPISIPSDSL